jgi:hypothetical protein
VCTFGTLVYNINDSNNNNNNDHNNNLQHVS